MEEIVHNNINKTDIVLDGKQENLLNSTENSKVFQHFHNRYEELLSFHSDSINNEKNKDVCKLVKTIIKELEAIICQLDKTEESYPRYLGMKTLLFHTLARSSEENESCLILERIHNEIQTHLSVPEVTFVGFLVINSLATLKQNLDNSLEDAKKILENGQMIYEGLRDTNKEDMYYSGKELFSAEEKMVSNTEAKCMFKKLAVANVLLLGCISESLGDHLKNIICYHTAFEIMFNNGLINPARWVHFMIRLSCMLMDDFNFKDARHHLAVATHVHEALETKEIYKNGPSEKEPSNSIHIALAWIRYCVLLFENSKDNSMSQFTELLKENILSVHNDNQSDRCDEKFEQNIIEKLGKEVKLTKNIDDERIEKLLQLGNRMKEATTLDEYTEEFEEILNKSTKDATTLDEYTEEFEEILNKTSYNTEEVEELNKNEINDVQNNDLTFKCLGVLPIENLVPDYLIRTPDDAKKLFNFGYHWSIQAQEFYTRTKDFYSYARVVLNLVSLYRLCANFHERDQIEYLTTLEQARGDLLEHLATELNINQFQSNTQVRLYSEIALLNIDLAKLNMWNIYNTDTENMLKTRILNRLMANTNQCSMVNQMLLDSLKSGTCHKETTAENCV